MSATERDTQFGGYPNPTPKIAPNPITGQSEPLQPMVGMYKKAYLPFGQTEYAPDPVGMLVPSKQHYDKLVGTAAMNPKYQSLTVSPHFQRVHDPRFRLPAGWEEWIDNREPPGATPIVYWDSVTRISTYDGPEVHGERAWVGVFGPPQRPLLPPVGPCRYVWGKRPPTQGPPYGQGQYLDPSNAGLSITPQLLGNHAPSASLQPPSHPILGPWINRKTVEKDASQRTAIAHGPAHDVPANDGVKRKKGVLLDKEGTTLIEATDYLGKKETRVARPPANRAASRYVGFAFNEGSVGTASANTHEERDDADRTPRPSDFKQKKVEGVRINVPEPRHVLPAVVTQGYKPGLQQEVFDRLFAMMTGICNTQTHLLANEAAQLAVQSLKAEIEGYLRDSLKQGKEERQRNLDLIKTLEFSEAKKFTDQYKSAPLPDHLLNEGVAKPETHEERIIKAQQEKQVKQTKQNPQPMGAFSYRKPNDDKKAALKNLKHAQPGDLYHLKGTPESSHAHQALPKQRIPMGDWSSSPIGFYTQENQLPQKDKQPPITSEAESKINRGSGIQTEPFATAAPEDDVFGPSQPPPPPPPPVPAPAAMIQTIAQLFEEPAILTLYDDRRRVVASRASDKDDSAEAMKAQLVTSAKKASRSYTNASTATAVFVGPVTDRNVSSALMKNQACEEDTRAWEIQPRITVGENAPQRRSSAMNVGKESRNDDTKLKAPKQQDLRKKPSILMQGGIADALSAAESMKSGTNNAKLNVPKQPGLRKKPSLLFMEGGIADALSAAESIKSEQGLWKPIDQLPLAISDRAHYGNDASDDSFGSTPVQVRHIHGSRPVVNAAQPAVQLPALLEANKVNDSKQYNHGGGIFGHTTKHSQTRIVSKGYKSSEASGGQQTSTPDPDLNNYYEISTKFPGGLGKNYINVATGKEYKHLPTGGHVVEVPRVAIGGEVLNNEAVDNFVAKYTSHIEKYKIKEAEREAQKAKAEADKKKHQEMSFLTANGPLGCGWIAVSDSGHNRHTSSNNFGNLTPGAIQIPSQARIPSARIPSARHTPVQPATSGFGVASGPGHPHWGQPSGLHTHHNPYGSNRIYNNPYGPPGTYGQSTQYNRFGAQQQQWGYQGQFNGPYGNHYAGGEGFGQGSFYQGGHQTTYNSGYGGGTPAYGPGGPFHNQGLAPPPNCTIRTNNNTGSRIFSNPFQ